MTIEVQKAIFGVPDLVGIEHSKLLHNRPIGKND